LKTRNNFDSGNVDIAKCLGGRHPDMRGGYGEGEGLIMVPQKSSRSKELYQ
jgi:hypothetical protein